MVKKKIQLSADELLAEALIQKEGQPYQIPDNWAWVRLNELISESQSGFACAKKNEVDKNDKIAYPHLRPNNIGFGGQLNLEKVVHIPINKVDKGKRHLKSNTVLFNNTNSKELVGRAVIISSDSDFAFSNHITKIIADSSLILPEWFVYSINKLWIDGFFLKNSKKWVGQAGYNQDMLKMQTFVSLPPLPEQKRIVSKLSSMLEKLKQAKELIQEAKESFEKRRAAILHLAFTGELSKQWRKDNSNINLELSKSIAINEIPFEIPPQWQWVLLKDVSEKPQYGTSSKSNKNGRIPVVRMGDIQAGRIEWDNLVYSSDETEIKKYNLEHNDILFNRTNSPALVGKTAIYKSEMPAIFAGYLIRVKTKKLLNPDYLNYFLNSPYAKMKCQAVKTDAVNQSNINAKKLSYFEIPLTSIEEQGEVVKSLNQLLDQEKEINHLLELENDIYLLEKSILSKAFRGELDTNDPDDEPAKDLLKKILQERQKTPLKKATRKQPKPKPKSITISAKPVSVKVTAQRAVITTSKESQYLFETIKEKMGKRSFSMEELKSVVDFSYEDLKSALFDLIKEPLEINENSTLKMVWESNKYMLQLASFVGVK